MEETRGWSEGGKWTRRGSDRAIRGVEGVTERMLGKRGVEVFG